MNCVAEHTKPAPAAGVAASFSPRLIVPGGGAQRGCSCVVQRAAVVPLWAFRHCDSTAALVLLPLHAAQLRCVSAMSAFPETSDSPVTPSHYGSCVESSDDSGTTKYSWLIAVLFCVGGAIVSNFGVNLQKMAHMQKNAGNAPPRKYRFLWFLGMACVVAVVCRRCPPQPSVPGAGFLGVVGGAIGDFAALGFGGGYSVQLLPVASACVVCMFVRAVVSVDVE